jgi:hypothetical protein
VEHFLCFAGGVLMLLAIAAYFPHGHGIGELHPGIGQESGEHEHGAPAHDHGPDH